VKTHGIIRSINPADFRQTVTTCRWSLELLGRAVRRAKQSFRDWSARSTWGARVRLLKKFKSILSKRSGKLADCITRETGKVRRESLEEVALLLSKIDITLDTAPALLNGSRVDGTAWIVERPYGVAAVLGPFNFPLHLPHGHIVPALLAGNTVVFKPSDRACGAGELYAECARSAGFPPGVLSVVQGPGDAGAFLAAHPDIALVLFTGSYAVGQKLQSAAARSTEKILALEMGGKNAAVIFEDASLLQAAAECIHGAFATAGQRCTSTSRIFAHRRVIDEFCGKFAALGGARALRVGDPFDPEMFFGPVISESAARRAESAIREARRLGGAAVISGGRFDADRGYFVRPSAHRFSRYPGRCRYTAEELFVPEVGIYPFSDVEEAIARVEDTDYGLAMSVFTARSAILEKMIERTRHGVVNWNLGTIGASGRLPFGGRKKSGNARPAAVFAVRNCVHPVAVRSRP